VAISSLYLTPNCKDLPLQLPDVPSILLLRAVTLLLTGVTTHESARTTGLYDRRYDEVSLDEVERIGI